MAAAHEFHGFRVVGKFIKCSRPCFFRDPKHISFIDKIMFSFIFLILLWVLKRIAFFLHTHSFIYAVSVRNSLKCGPSNRHIWKTDENCINQNKITSEKRIPHHSGTVDKKIIVCRFYWSFIFIWRDRNSPNVQIKSNYIKVIFIYTTLKENRIIIYCPKNRNRLVIDSCGFRPKSLYWAIIQGE